ncbi:LLM class flavin-dependent oxidoreductase [Actinomadura sp. DC4]|uniref:LLM class flavin-dependent oxidoreductase n=1 Tax=Actinomadura sp. DC4 TaxID=3055069 RepID=UPI0025B1519C|nr:LLM class flavin-dependent oxidoreductase [Actinomadura sp. DC4]MDN3351461.1 LLM class flavin-dependent oxidoreductase [Actinomadura sp. DC4]
MRVGVILWPIDPWQNAREQWLAAEDLGFDAAWVYDHVAWRGITPWHDAYTTLAAAAVETSRIRIGTLVTSPNFRHPLPTAHAVRAIDDLSGGRLDLGIGAGGTRRASDAGVLDDAEWPPPERADRLAEWVELMDLLLRGPRTTFEGRFWSAYDAVTEPGCVQRPRVPFAIAGGGPRGIRLAATYADTWVTLGSARPGVSRFDTVRAQLSRLSEACAAEGRSVRALLCVGDDLGEPWMDSIEAYRDLAGRYAELGVTDLALHWPHEKSPFKSDLKVLEQIAADL